MRLSKETRYGSEEWELSGKEPDQFLRTICLSAQTYIDVGKKVLSFSFRCV